MAGIGFELKRLFGQKGISARIRAMGYTGMITTGPLILGIIFLLLISWLARAGGMSASDTGALLSMVTYALVLSQLVNGMISMCLTRYVSDMLYEGEDGQVRGSLVGALALELPVGAILYGIFLGISGIGFDAFVLNEALFAILMAVWLETAYLTAVKDYRGILRAYLFSIIAGVGAGALVCALGDATTDSMLACVCLGYGLMMALSARLIARAFPEGGGSLFAWLAWFDRYPELMVIGLATSVGLFAHVLFCWGNPTLHQVNAGWFYTAPTYDIPALYAMLTMIPTTITFVATTEVEFYPRYRRYFDLLNGTGSITQVDAAQDEMLEVLGRETARLARRQLIFTVAAVGIGTELLDMLPLGFTPFMNGVFRALCVGYGAYAVANVLMLVLMYFSDYRDAMRAAITFAACVVVAGALSLVQPTGWLGFGFAVSGIAYYAVAMIELNRYVRKLPAVVFTQNASGRGDGRLARLGERLERLL